VKRQLSLDQALKALKSLGLTDIDAQVYVYLSKRGPHGLIDLGDALKVTNLKLARSLENLLARGMVDSAPEPRGMYSAVPLERVLNEFEKAAKEKAKALQASKDELLRVWRIVKRDLSSNS